ncbi:MAG TPA: hypothetical protein VLZ54_09480 [Arenibacter sp.]|nr:hypothetical protein [Arenibacter sp.]
MDYADEKGLLGDIVGFQYYVQVGKERDPPDASGAYQRRRVIVEKEECVKEL